MHITVRHDPKARRFLANPPDGGLAYLAYERRDGVLDLTHTVVPSSARGEGIGAALVGTALELARRERLRVVPTCSYVRQYIDEHPEYADLVARE